MAFQLGSVYGGYEFIDIESSSPLGIAYKVRNRALNRIELLRVLSQTDEDAEVRSERFLREASVHARLTHPNIVTFYAGMVLEDQFVIATELIEGTTLAQRLELGPLSVEQAISDITQVLSALSRAHEMGVAHRDVRPENLIVTPEGIIKLSGFTFARGSADTQVTQYGATPGDVHYLSPEQVKGESTPDPCSDIYSTGVVLYELLTGRKPFDSSSHFEVMLAHVASQPVPPRDINPGIPPELEAVILKAMAKEPAGRFPSADAFLAALESVTTRLSVAVPVPEPAVVEMPFPAVPALAPAPAMARAAVAVEPEEVPEPEIEPQPASEGLPADLVGMQFGLREVVVLAAGILLMVASVMFITHS